MRAEQNRLYSEKYEEAQLKYNQAIWEAKKEFDQTIDQLETDWANQTIKR